MTPKTRNILITAVTAGFVVMMTTYNRNKKNVATNTASTVASNSNAAVDLQKTVYEINQKCPMMTDDETRLDSVSQKDNFLLTYHLTLPKVSNKNYDISKFKVSMQEKLCNDYVTTTDPSYQSMRKSNIALAYDYKDKDGGFMAYFICEPNK